MKTNIAGVERDSGPFAAFRVMCYATFGDRDAERNGTVRYALTMKETRDSAPVVTEIEVILKEGHFKVTTSDNHSGITDAGSLIGLDQAIQRGIATVRDLA